MRLAFLLFILFLFSASSLNSLGLQLNPPEYESTEALSFIVLSGVIVSENERLSVALIKDNRSGEDFILKIGEAIDDFKLVRILGNRIVFRRDQNTYPLFLGRYGIFKSNRREDESSSSDIATQARGASVLNTEEDAVTKEFSRSYLEQRILAEWKMLLEQTEFSPYTLNGQPKGFKLTKIPAGSLLSEIGLRQNDIILELNGEELKDRSLIISLIDRFKNEDRGILTIERDGRQFRYAFVLK